MDDADGDVARPGLSRPLAALAVVLSAALLSVLPGLVVLGAATGAGRGVVAVIASVAAAVGGLKLVAIAWGLAAATD